VRGEHLGRMQGAQDRALSLGSGLVVDDLVAVATELGWLGGYGRRPWPCRASIWRRGMRCGSSAQPPSSWCRSSRTRWGLPGHWAPCRRFSTDGGSAILAHRFCMDPPRPSRSVFSRPNAGLISVQATATATRSTTGHYSKPPVTPMPSTRIAGRWPRPAATPLHLAGVAGSHRRVRPCFQVLRTPSAAATRAAGPGPFAAVQPSGPGAARWRRRSRCRCPWSAAPSGPASGSARSAPQSPS